MSWNFDRFLKSQIGFFQRRTLFRHAIKAFRTDLLPVEYESIEELMHGFGWAADRNMNRVPESDCLSILVLTPFRVVIGGGRLTCDISYEEIEDCFWQQNDLCISVRSEDSEYAGIRFEPMSQKWTDGRRKLFRHLVMEHVRAANANGRKESQTR
ncbi:MAG: hypothetical protein IH983_11115 [Planctomycetes bacterium]|nr:hypothetical protein [Planctomycetota bacterium]